MEFIDLELFENGNGSDFVIINNDLKTISGFQNMPYIALFGGNLKQDTTGPKILDISEDFWGNYLFLPNDPKMWINSTTERLLRNISLTSNSRREVEQAVKFDLAFMEDFANVSVSVSLIGVDKLRIEIELREPNNSESKIFVYIWSATNKELSNPQSGDIVTENFDLQNFLQYIL
jgi:hypothetical protein